MALSLNGVGGLCQERGRHAAAALAINADDPIWSATLASHEPDDRQRRGFGEPAATRRAPSPTDIHLFEAVMGPVPRDSGRVIVRIGTLLCVYI